MQDIVGGMAAMAFVIAAGLVFSLLSCKTTNQRFACTAAFGSLVLVLVIYYLEAAGSSPEGSIPVFAACVALVPTAVYLLVMSLLGRAARESAPPRSEETPRNGNAPRKEAPRNGNAPRKEGLPVIPRGIPLRAGMQPPSIVKMMQPPVPQAAGAACSNPIVPQTMDAARGNPVVPPITKPLPMAENVSAMTTAPIIVEPATAEPTTAVTPLAPAPTLAPAEATAAKTSCAVFEKEASPAPMEAQSPAEVTVSVAAEDYFSYACRMKEEGASIVAARLFAESALLYDDDASRRKATFEAMVCYVKGNQEPEARVMATALSKEAECLSPIELIKVDAVLRRGL